MAPFFLIFAYMCVPYFVYSIVFSCLYKMYSINRPMKNFATRIGQEVPLKYKVISFFCLAVLAIIGTWQVLQYYLFSGAYFWFVLLTAGLVLLVYLAPIGLCVSPFIKFNSNGKNRLRKFYCNFVGSYTLMWAIILLVDKNIKIYSDESGISYRNGNLPLKMLGGIGLLIVGLYGLVSISAKYSNSYPKNKVEESAWTLAWSSIVVKVTKKINHLKKNNRYHCDKPLFIALMPLILLMSLVVVFLLLGDLFILVTLRMNLFPFIILFIAVLLLRKVWLSTRVGLRIKKIGATVLTIMWLIVFLLLVLRMTIKTDPIYILEDSIFLLVNGYSFIWTWIDISKTINSNDR